MESSMWNMMQSPVAKSPVLSIMCWSSLSPQSSQLWVTRSVCNFIVQHKHLEFVLWLLVVFVHSLDKLTVPVSGFQTNNFRPLTKTLNGSCLELSYILVLSALNSPQYEIRCSTIKNA
jgi:hypothetical protein